MPFVYSTCSSSGTYCDYPPINESNKNRSHNVAIKRVTIKGGANVAHQQKGAGQGGIWTPRGVMTEVSDEDLDFLLKNEAFQRHMAAGHISYDKKKIDPEKRAQSMAPRDGSAPLTPEGFVESENSSPDARIYQKKEDADMSSDNMKKIAKSNA